MFLIYYSGDNCTFRNHASLRADAVTGVDIFLPILSAVNAAIDVVTARCIGLVCAYL